MMPENIKEVKDFVKVEAEALRKEIIFYYDTQICLSQLNKGILYGKKMAYDKMLSFVDRTEHSQEEKK